MRFHRDDFLLEAIRSVSHAHGYLFYLVGPPQLSLSTDTIWLLDPVDCRVAGSPPNSCTPFRNAKNGRNLYNNISRKIF